MTVLIIILCVIAALVIIDMFIGAYFYGIVINRSTIKGAVTQDPKLYDGDKPDSFDSYTQYLDWYAAEIDGRKNYIESFDGLRLCAEYSPRGSDTLAICVHGYNSIPFHMAAWAKHYFDKGYDILMPSLRGHADSEGEYVGMGWHDRLDILAWINWALEKNPDYRIILHGVSMGAATVMMLSGEKLPDNVKVLVEDCGYDSAANEFAYSVKLLYKLLPFIVIPASSLISRIRARYSFYEASSVKQLKKASVPMLFIHGSKDVFVPYFMLDRVYDAAACPKEKLTVDGAEHARSIFADPELYWNTVDRFIDNHM